MMKLDRRRFLALSTAATGAVALPASLVAEATRPAGSFRFVFFTDTHLDTELSANEATAKCFAKVRSLKPEFCIQGGDHCMDLTEVPRARSTTLFDLYAKTEHVLDMPVHHVLGNHDLFGRDVRSGVSSDDPLYGKKAFEQRYGKTYRSWNHKGYHFIVLDAIAITNDRQFNAWVDAEQLKWLATDRFSVPSGTPIVVASHVPLVSAAPQYKPPYIEKNPAAAKYHGFLLGNAYEVLPLFEGHNVIAVLQGHTHINEVVYWRDIPFITSGAVCGNWWKGSRWGTPEGFTVLELDNGKVHWHYETYGWASVAPVADPLRSISNPHIAGNGPS